MNFLSPNLRVVIDARPRSARGLIAGELVLGKSLLGHTIDQAHGLANRVSPIVVIASVDDQPLLTRLLGHLTNETIELTTSYPSSDALILRTDRLYQSRRLRVAARNGRDPETAVLWRLDDPRSIEVAGEELVRRRSYQPLGRYWAFPLSRAIAKKLVATPVRPNALTLGVGLLMLTASAVIASTPSNFTTRIVVAVALAVALVLDTADGHLARLQGTASPFGRWLDNILDELADVSLHASIAWAGFVGTRQPIWLVLGILFVSGKYLYVVQSMAGEILDRTQSPPAESTIGPSVDEYQFKQLSSSEWLRRVVRGLGHADFRWHLWIVLALVGRLDIALYVYAFYFPIRTGMSCLKRGVDHAIA